MTPADEAILIPLGTRFWSKVTEEGACWIWTAAKSSGYGRYKYSGRDLVAHRLAYRELVGWIPEGLVLDHLCRNRACVNPWHLDPVTDQVNLWRGMGSGKETHCPHGHPYSGANLRRRRGRRECMTCVRAAERRRIRAPRSGRVAA